ncbi:copper amine oxidase N-terminal domain-containing protein [Paenibacillus septentrionalis]|uniref:Copper amine oxidase N-terminal domain-containing protein n=1 Tax=Paenibacillus septentrionalis TaxID=429342 RepID=A0ABW1V359_9BACL
MKKALLTVIMFCLVAVGLPVSLAEAAPKTASVKLVDQDAILLEDGTLWLKRLWEPTGYKKYETDFTTIFIGSNMKSYALNSKGELVYWENSKDPVVDKKQNNIKQLDGYDYLKNDGTVWDVYGQKNEKIKDAVLIGTADNEILYVNNQGEIRITSSIYLLDKVDDPSSVVAMEGYSNRYAAYLDKNGKVVAADLTALFFNTNDYPYSPVTVTEDAVDISFHSSGALIVTKKDGTVWLTDPSASSKDRFKLTSQVTEIKNAVQTSLYYGTLVDDPNAGRNANQDIIVNTGRNVPQWLVKHKDGSWKVYRDGQVFNIESPVVSGLTITASSTKPSVGDKLSFKIVQTYSNGYKENLPGKEAKLTFDKPYLVKALSDGTYKTLGVGETKVSVSANDNSKSTTVSISLSANLTGAISKDNTTYLPLVSVFKALGATISNKDSKTFDISLGDQKLQLKTGQKKAKLNGKDITLNQPVQVLNGSTVFPASLLTKASIAKIEWDKKYKKMKISIGKASMVVESSETAAIEKKEKQGSLSQFINKSYWVNRYSNWERFMKLTVTDIVPAGGDNFDVVFKSAGGKTYTMGSTSRDFVSSILNDQYTFLPFDPYKKYNWSASTWKLIKAEKVAVGMSKTQVELSWGRPSSTSKLTSNGFTVEVWRYGTQYVSFTNGIVQSIYTL